MKPGQYSLPSQSLVAVTARQIARRPHLSLSIFVHAMLWSLAYYFGSYQVGLRERAEEFTSSLRATNLASANERLQNLETIKQLLEKSANRAETGQVLNRDPETIPQTPADMLERARELSEAIETLDEEIRAEELADLLGALEPPAEVAEPPKVVPPPRASNEAEPESGEPETGEHKVTPERAAAEVTALEAEARALLASRQQRLEAMADGVLVQTGAAGSGKQPGGEDPNALAGGHSRVKVREEIADFLASGPPGTQRVDSSSYNDWAINLSDLGDFAVPPLDSSTQVLGGGRMLGAGGEYANRVHINSWYIIGPFAGRHGDALFDNPVYPPEKAVLLDAVYLGKDERVLRWRYVTTQRYPLDFPDQVVDGVYYGYTEVSVDEDCDLTAWIGADDDAQVYVNERLVWRGGKVRKMPFFNTIFAPGATHTRDYNRSEGTRVVRFKKGRNEIFFKLSNGAQGMFFSMVLTR
jgi:hypothetical protein